MSFCYDIKTEICSKSVTNEESAFSIMYPIFSLVGVFVDFSAFLCFENVFLARFTYKVTKKYLYKDIKFVDRCDLDFPIANKKIKYILKIEPFEIEPFKIDFELLKRNKNSFVGRDFLKGVFLACGFMGSPVKYYHLEFRIKDKSIMEFCDFILQSYSVYPKRYFKDGFFVLYVKDIESIVDILHIFDLQTEAFRVEDIRTIKEFRNQANRASNCDNANLKRILKASCRQIEAIEKIGIHNLPDSLVEIASLRVENPEVDLETLGKMLKNPLSKHTVRSRLLKIEKLVTKEGSVL